MDDYFMDDNFFTDTFSKYFYEAAMLLGFIIIGLVIFCVYLLIVNYFIYKKAGKPGWTSLVPFYSSYILAEITWGNGIWFLLSFASVIPTIGTAVFLGYSIVTNINLGKAFGKSNGFIVGLIFLFPIFASILAFDKKTVYVGTSNNIFKVKPNGNKDVNSNVTVSNYNQQADVSFQTENVVNNNVLPVQSTPAKFCSNCGSKVESDAMFCGNCGNKLN